MDQAPPQRGFQINFLGTGFGGRSAQQGFGGGFGQQPAQGGFGPSQQGEKKPQKVPQLTLASPSKFSETALSNMNQDLYSIIQRNVQNISKAIDASVSLGDQNFLLTARRNIFTLTADFDDISIDAASIIPTANGVIESMSLYYLRVYYRYGGSLIGNTKPLPARIDYEINHYEDDVHNDVLEIQGTFGPEIHEEKPVQRFGAAGLSTTTTRIMDIKSWFFLFKGRFRKLNSLDPVKEARERSAKFVQDTIDYILADTKRLGDTKGLPNIFFVKMYLAMNILALEIDTPVLWIGSEAENQEFLRITEAECEMYKKVVLDAIKHLY